MKVGDYVRTKDGRIDKIESIHNGLYVLENFPYSYNEYWLIKSSPNIIDLIEVGDYVNGHLVFDKAPNCVYIEDKQNKMAHIPYIKDNIESVLTKELFESMEYKIGE